MKKDEQMRAHLGQRPEVLVAVCELREASFIRLVCLVNSVKSREGGCSSLLSSQSYHDSEEPRPHHHVTLSHYLSLRLEKKICMHVL